MIIQYLSIYSILIPLFVGVLRFKVLLKHQKYFLAFLSFSVIVEIISNIISHYQINNFFVFKFFLIIDLLFFTYLFAKNKLSYSWSTNFGILLGSILAILYFANFFIYYEFNFSLLFFTSAILFLIIQSGIANLIIFKTFEFLPYKSSFFWIASARILYYLFILFIFVYPSIVRDSFNIKIFDYAFMLINAFANISLNLFYSKSLLCK